MEISTLYERGIDRGIHAGWQTLCRSLTSEDDHFTPSCLIKRVPNLGMVIDLTNTSRYYDNLEFLNSDVEHVKILCEGHVIPSVAVITKFFTAIDSFVQTPANKDKLIAVHCTHGLNRTGYLVCRYMIQKLSFQPANAIQAFGAARGHVIERPNYLQDLMQATWPVHSMDALPEASITSSAESRSLQATAGSSATYSSRSKHHRNRDRHQRPNQNELHGEAEKGEFPGGNRRFRAPDNTFNQNRPHPYNQRSFYRDAGGLGHRSSSTAANSYRSNEGRSANSAYWREDCGYEEFRDTPPVPPPPPVHQAGYYSQHPSRHGHGAGFYTRPAADGPFRGESYPTRGGGYKHHPTGSNYPDARSRNRDFVPRNDRNGNRNNGW